MTAPARLEPWGADDLPLLEKLLGDPAMMGYLGGPESRLAAEATVQLLGRAAAERRRRFMHAFPSVDNEASNAICRKLGFELLGRIEVEYPAGHGRIMLTNDWRFDLESLW